MMGTKSDKWQVFPVRLSGKTIEALRREAERRNHTIGTIAGAVCLGAVELGAGDLVSAWPEGSFSSLLKNAGFG